MDETVGREDAHEDSFTGRGSEHGFGLIGLGKVYSAGEENDSNEEEEDQEAQLPQAGLECLPEYLQTLGMAGELEDTEHTNKADDSEDSKRHCLLPTTLLFG